MIRLEKFNITSINILIVVLIALTMFSCTDETVLNADESTKFRVVFETNGALKLIEDQVFYTRGKVIKPADPFKSSFVFTGWKQEGQDSAFDFETELSITNVPAVVKLIAEYLPGFDVSFDCLDGAFSDGEKIKLTTVLPNTQVVAPPIQVLKKGYSFEAWCTDAAGTTVFDFTTPIIKPVDPTRSGFTFVCWVKENGDVFDFNSTLTETVQLYALWGMNENAFNFSNGVIKGLTPAFSGEEYIEVPATIGGVPVTEIGTDAFNGNTKIKELTLPPSVKTIAKNAFKSCTGLKKFIISGVVTIGVDAFTSSGIEKINLPSTFVSLSNNAFVSCKSLTEVHFPASFKNTGTGWTFWNCSNLALIICDAVDAPVLGGNDFMDWVNAIAVIPALKAIKVPRQSVNQYKEKWSDYAHLIVSQ